MQPNRRRPAQPSLGEVLDQEAAPVEAPAPAPVPALPSPGQLCGAPHHTDPAITCQRPAGHEETAVVARDLHAAYRIWNDGDTDPSWATWS